MHAHAISHLRTKIEMQNEDRAVFTIILTTRAMNRHAGVVTAAGASFITGLGAGC